MTDEQLRAIEARHHSAQWTLTPSSQISTCDAIADIPALVAEVRRLRAQVDAVSEAFAEWESVRTFRNDINSHEWLALVAAMTGLEQCHNQ